MLHLRLIGLGVVIIRLIDSHVPEFITKLLSINRKVNKVFSCWN